jgi:polyhydroxybutyrate depolymerase
MQNEAMMSWRQLRAERITGHKLLRRARLLILLLACVTLAACAPTGRSNTPVPVSLTTARPSADQSALSTMTTTVQRDLTVGGMRRSYLAVGSARPHPHLPLLVVLHGRGITARQDAARTGFLTYAEQGAANIVYPMGFADSWNAGHGCCGGAAKAGVNDTAFVTEVVLDASRHFESDPARVYLVGYSNGGRLAFDDVCQHPTTFTAFATYGAAPLATCTNSNAPPVPVLIGVGTNDSVVHSTNPRRTATQAVESVAAQWRVRDFCTAAATTTHVGPLTLTKWIGCRDGSAVETALYSGITHNWPTAGPTSAPYTTEVSSQAAAATVMWDFLTQYRRG